MNDYGELALDVLRSQNIALLLRLGPRQYVCCGEMPDFYNELFPPDENGPCNTPWEHSPMLEFFMDDAEAFFERHLPECIASGVWQEDGRTDEDSALLASACEFNHRQALIIRLLNHEYVDRVSILRKARNQLLENRELAQNLEIFKKRSRFDGLTKVFNRLTFMEILEDEIAASRADGRPLSFLILDIDNFKRVNDEYGHVAGDEVLQTLAALLLQNLRRGDIIGRYGGEEFVMLLPDTAVEQAASVGEKLRKRIESQSIGEIPVVTVSMGCTAFRPGEDIRTLIQRADQAMYEAKNSGKNRIIAR